MLMHPWFAKFDESDNSTEKAEHLDLNVISRLEQYRGVSRFKHACMDILVKMASEEELHELTNAFKIIDKDGTGLIKAHELSEIIQHHNLAISDDDIARMIKESDYAGNG